MSLENPSTRENGAPRFSTGTILRLVALLLLDTFAVWFIYASVQDGVYWLSLAVAILTIFLNVVFLRSELYPIRWMSVGLVFMGLFAIYPILFTVYVAFTNYGTGHLLTKPQVIEQLESRLFLPEDAVTYTWAAFEGEDGTSALVLESDAGELFFARPDEPLQPVTPGEGIFGPLDEEGIPETIEGFERLTRAETLRAVQEISEQAFGEPPRVVRVQGFGRAAELEPAFVYDPDQDVIISQETGEIYQPIDGTFTSADGDTLTPGFQTTIGFENFENFVTSPALQGPLLRIIIWNFAFATLSVLTTFAMGLFVALIYNDPSFPAKKVIRSFLLVPYTIPSLITILIWRGLLNPQVGIVSETLQGVFGASPPWFSDPMWAKIGILLINLWLGYPYFMLICSGALQAIPGDIYEAAEVDGASAWQRFWRLTLPLLLVAVGPLLIASFTFNFNNFNVIYLYNRGGPPIANTPTPAGHTDLLITYVYQLAFGSRGAQYGLASAITIIIFFIVAALTLFQFRYTTMWEEVGENV
ncbi:MAG: ABC transporter permease subunit [Candidatus Promineifilaceae bacterium]|nr:ABC transporter permease subunit [Candidatus Promineifilaceae bacterium]